MVEGREVYLKVFSCIVQNIPVEYDDITGKPIGKSYRKLKSLLVEFEYKINWFEPAFKLEKPFERKGQGRDAWYSNTDKGRQPYIWVARQADRHSFDSVCKKDKIGTFLEFVSVPSEWKEVALLEEDNESRRRIVDDGFANFASLLLAPGLAEEGNTVATPRASSWNNRALTKVSRNHTRASQDIDFHMLRENREENPDVKQMLATATLKSTEQSDDGKKKNFAKGSRVIMSDFFELFMNCNEWLQMINAMIKSIDKGAVAKSSLSFSHIDDLCLRLNPFDWNKSKVSFGQTIFHLFQDIQKLEWYLPLLENFIAQVDSIPRNKNVLILQLGLQWSSTLSTSRFRIGGPKFFQINSLKYELGMALFLYGVTIRERAFEVLSEDMQQSACLLRKAAGIYQYLDAEVLPLLQSILSPEKPPETTTNVSSAMNNICLADAQASIKGIAIRMAEKQGLSAGALAKLNYAVTQFLDEASNILQSGPRDISRRFLEFISCCSTLHELRSYRYLAESYKHSEQVGVAIGLLNCAVSKAKNLPGEQSWREVFKIEVKKVSDMLKKYSDENAFVWRHKIPLDFELPSMEGRMVVAATPYEPQRWERVIVFNT
ncbi:BRO1 domain-containing protein BROX [Bienertia sinuspersici]